MLVRRHFRPLLALVTRHAGVREAAVLAAVVLIALASCYVIKNTQLSRENNDFNVI